jgi:hypothetical protein
MIKEAEQFKDDDDKIAKHIEAKNKLESYCLNVQNTVLNDSKMKSALSEDDVNEKYVIKVDGADAPAGDEQIEDPAVKENTAAPEIDEEELKQMKIVQEEDEEQRQIKLIQEEEEKELKKSLTKTKKENIKKPNIKKENKEPIDDSYNPDAKPNIIKEEGDLNKPEMEKVSDIDVEKIKEKLKK